jgi:hypothetical protein
VFVAHVFNAEQIEGVPLAPSLVSVPGTRLKRLNSLFKQQILNFSTVPVIVRTTDRQRIRSICL